MSDGDAGTGERRSTPLELLGVLAEQRVTTAPGLEHLELFTMEGLLTLLWHGRPTDRLAVLACGGAMGGMLGPADGLYHDLGTLFAEEGIQTVRVGYRKPNDLGRCVHDVAAALELAFRNGAERAVVMGHSFGGAVAVRVGAAFPDLVAGVVTLATQSAGCEVAEHLAGRPLLLLHGDADELLPVEASRMVQMIAGGGELVVLPGTGHLLTQSGDAIRERLLRWIPAVLNGEAP